MTGGILLLILFTPLAFGSVHPWAFGLMEAVVFLLVIVWMGKLLLERPGRVDAERRGCEDGRRAGLLFLPLALFVTFVFFQLLPLPPTVLHFLSPATYELYSKSLPGWPERMPYESIASVEIAGQETNNTSSSQPVTHHALWRPLSLAPVLTHTNLLQFLAYLSLFSLVLLYPFGSSRSDQRSAVSDRPQSEERFVRTVLLMVLCTGLLVAALGVVQRFTWNGKILWFFVPYDWGAPSPGGEPRASGPFVNPDHFANYLALIFPLALVGTLSDRLLTPRRSGNAFRPALSGAGRLFCGVVALILTLGILLSLSRGAWIGTAVGTSILFWVLSSSPPERSLVFPRKPQGSMIRFSLAGCCLLLALALFFVGPAGRGQVDVRLEQTVTEDTGVQGRLVVWPVFRDMVRDFPWFGVGLGAWPELYPRYQQPPWSRDWYSEAHNDYLELFADTGLFGFGLLVWFFWQVARKLYHGLWTVSAEAFPVAATLVAALGTMAFHEFVDFNLQIPANAFLFTLFLGLALRLTESTVHSPQSTVHSRFRIPVLVSIGVIASVLCSFALRQQGPPYPYDVKEPDSVVEARELLFSYPARSSLHRSLFSFLQDTAAPADWLNELQVAVWLEPLHPFARDLYAAGLVAQGREQEALQEMTRSVAFAPTIAPHIYLYGQGPSLLSEAAKNAVEEGFKQALTSGYDGAVEGLGAFYSALDRFTDAGKLYEEIALRAEETDAQLGYLLNAGLAYVRAAEMAKAEALFRQVIKTAPQDSRAYQYLVVQVYIPGGDMASAKDVVAEGIQNGVDPLPLLFSVAEAAQRAGDREEAKAALLQALTFAPFSVDAQFRLGLFYAQEQNFDRAVLSFRKVTDLRPDDASAFYHLGVAEEGRYQFFAAQKAYARAVELAPDNVSFQQRYDALQHKVAEAKGQ